VQVPTSRSTAAADALHHSDLDRGAVVGRYLVLDRIGAGAMGTVYAAYDPELDRRIALKALRANPAEGLWLDPQTLAREAKAMARLSHPNVVAVYDVVAGDEQVFIAMELVDGQSLRAWLDSPAAPRTEREILEVFIQAGRGLAAAHAAGIVHRDFKPDNVLIGRDGRVRVADFGLARPLDALRAGPASNGPASDPLRGPVEASLSMGHALQGTPRFMAPELFEGRRADARTDQFAFCVSLWGALFGVEPFQGDDLLSLVANVREGRITVPARAGPASPRSPLMRGLSQDPAKRYPTMEALLAELERDPGAPWRRRAAASAGLLIVLSLCGAVVAKHRAEVRGCEALTHRLDGVWDESSRHAVHEAFEKTRLAYAGEADQRITRILDDYASAWSRSVLATCESPPGLEAVASRRDACYDERLTQLKALGQVLAAADPDVVEHAVQAARALPDVATCAGADPLGDRTEPTDPTLRAQARALEERLRVAEVAREAGRAKVGIELASANVDEAERIGFAPLVAEARLELGRAQWESEDRQAADATLRRATLDAEAAGVPGLGARAWIAWGRVAAGRSDWALADERFDFAQACLDRIGDQGSLRGELLLRRGERLSDEGQFEAARAVGEKALPLLERTGSALTSQAIKDLGVTADMQGRYPEARAYYQRALASYEAFYGPGHPYVATVFNNIGLMEADDGHLAEGAMALERAFAITQGAFGDDYPRTIQARFNLAIVYEGQSRYADALPIARQAVASADRIYGLDDSTTAYALGALANALVGLGRPEEAIEPATRELKIRESHPGYPVLQADAETDLGAALLDSGRDVTRGRALLAAARDAYVAAGHLQRMPDVEAALHRADARSARR
jgi:serine/threonine-protein kinase